MYNNYQPQRDYMPNVNGFTPYRNQFNKPMNRNFNNESSWNFRNGGKGYYPQQRQVVKHSGCTSGITKNTNKPYVRGWKYDKRNGLRSFIAGPYESKNSTTNEHKSKTGRIWENWCVKITLSDGQTILKSALYDQMTGKVIIKELGYVMNPKGGKGGYVGTFTNK